MGIFVVDESVYVDGKLTAIFVYSDSLGKFFLADAKSVKNAPNDIRQKIAEASLWYVLAGDGKVQEIDYDDGFYHVSIAEKYVVNTNEFWVTITGTPDDDLWNLRYKFRYTPGSQILEFSVPVYGTDDIEQAMKYVFTTVQRVV